MSVPDSFVIPAEVPLSHQYKIVGNGVAFLVASSLAKALRVQMEMWRDKRRHQAS